MKIAIVTWISYNNYGTFLQAFALQSFLCQNGYDAYLLSDQRIIPWLNISKKENAIVCNKPYQKGGKVVHIVKELVNNFLPYIKKIIYRYRNAIVQKQNNKKLKYYFLSKQLFATFKQTKMIIDSEVFPNDLDVLNNKYDIFVAGSDQIWSVLQEKMLTYYFLDFVTKKKIAYAPSMGNIQIDQNKQKQLSVLLNDFCFLSVREEKSAIQLSKITSKKVEWVCDPTLLIGIDFWKKQTEDISVNKSNYILCYFLEDSSWYYKYAEEMAKKTHTHLALIPNNKSFVNRKYAVKSGIGPLEFVAWIRKAKYILTDSYHGMLFSIIFNKTFIPIKRFFDKDPNNQNIRLDTISKITEKEDIFISEKQFVIEDIPFFEWEKINRNIQKYREQSIRFFLGSLGEENDM